MRRMSTKFREEGMRKEVSLASAWRDKHDRRHEKKLTLALLMQARSKARQEAPLTPREAPLQLPSSSTGVRLQGGWHSAADADLSEQSLIAYTKDALQARTGVVRPQTADDVLLPFAHRPRRGLPHYYGY